jgi:transporter family-2 protein
MRGANMGLLGLIVNLQNSALRFCNKNTFFQWTQVSSNQKGYDMETILILILIGLAGGVAVGLQSPMASILTQRLGLFESVFIVHLGGAVIALMPLLARGGGRLSHWQEAPWYTLGAGIFGLVVIAAISYTIPRVGVAAAITTVVAGQILTGAVIDHFGLFHSSIRHLDPTRVLGLVVVLLGVWLTVR